MTTNNPPHPGEFIRKTYIEPSDISLRSLADGLGVVVSTASRLLAGKIAVSPVMAMRLSKALGRSPESWLQMQGDYDLWRLQQPESRKLFAGIKRIKFDKQKGAP